MSTKNCECKKVIYAKGVYSICSKCGKRTWIIPEEHRITFAYFLKKNITAHSTEHNDYSVYLNSDFSIFFDIPRQTNITEALFTCTKCKYSTECDEDMLQHIHEHIKKGDV